MPQLLTLPEAVKLLRVPATTLQRWIRLGEVPCQMRNGEARFQKNTLLAWAKKKHLFVGKTSGITQQRQQANLLAALERGGVHAKLSAENRGVLFQDLETRLNVHLHTNAPLATLLEEREQLASTAIGQGLAVPHPQTPGMLELSDSVVAIGLPKIPVEFEAADGEPIIAVFVLLSVDATHHLQLLAQLTRLLRNPELMGFLHTQPLPDALLEAFRKSLDSAAH
jgi:PTS system nitrogen regulatory IIA component